MKSEFIPNAAVEAAAKALRAHKLGDPDDWDSRPEHIKAMWRDDVMSAILAAAPHIAAYAGARALRDAADDLRASLTGPGRVPVLEHPAWGAAWLDDRADWIETGQ